MPTNTVEIPETSAPDPIAALTELNSATEAYKESVRAQRDAREREDAALRKLDEVQRQFDTLYRQLRSSAPAGSYWEEADSPF